MTICDFDVHVRILSSDGATVRVDLDDHANGLSVQSGVSLPEMQERQGRATSPYAHGSAPTSLPVDDDGILRVVVRVEGASWAQCAQRWAVVRAAWKAEPAFVVETVIEGVVTRWRAERAGVVPGEVSSSSLITKWQTYALRFLVQPNPTISYV